MPPGRPATEASAPLLEGAPRFDAAALAARREPPCRALAQLLRNAQYWLSFQVARFEPLLRFAPSPLVEVGVGVLLRFGESPSGHLEPRDLEAARAAFSDLPPDVAGPFSEALGVLERGVGARERLPALEGEGFRPTQKRGGVSAFALRAAGRAVIAVGGHAGSGRVEVPLGTPLTVTATDERARPLPPPEISSSTGAPVWRDGADPPRILLLVPGDYTAQVPGRASGARRLLAR
jgi:hypothetical protein